MNNFTQQQIADACRKYGSSIGPLPAGANGTQLFWALAGMESEYGKNCTPRHEPAYDKGGAYATHAPMPELLPKFGQAAACSYGPWQLMFCEAPQALPVSFNSLDLCASYTVAFLNSHLRAQEPQDIAAIGRMYNGGNKNTKSLKAIMYGHGLYERYFGLAIPGGTS